MSKILAVIFTLTLLLVSTRSLWITGALAVNVLVSGPKSYNDNSLNVTANQYLNVSTFHLVLEPDCHLVVYNGSTPFLTTSSWRIPRGPCYATLQRDVNFVIYYLLEPVRVVEDAVWASNTQMLHISSVYFEYFRSYSFIVFQSDGSLGMYGPDGTKLQMTPFIPVPSPASLQVNATANVTHPFPPELEWKPTLPLDGYPYLPANYFLSQGTRLQTMDQRFILFLGHDCKLQSQEMWQGNNTMKRVVWEPHQSMVGVIPGNCELRLQQDGVLEVRDNVSGVVYWNSSVRGDGSVSWVLKVDADDGHVSVSDILDPTHVLWRSILKQQRAAPVWPIAVAVVGTSVLFLVAAGLGFWKFYVWPRILDPNEKAFQQRLDDIGAKCQVFSQAKIKVATNSFRMKIGSGGCGDVFYGKLKDGREIAAKVLQAGSHRSKEVQFFNEIELLSVVHHKYLVSLLGYSSTRKYRVLIYEYMGGGDLRHRLQGEGAARSPLTWRQRTSITLQIAEGLEYLHDKCSPAIIHRDVKSNNILLTQTLVAKVADFGLSKLRRKDQEDATFVTTGVRGTLGYLDPEYYETGLLSEKSDVYAFGIVLMEILTGQDQINISQGVSEARRLGQVEDLADPNLRGEFDKEEFARLVELSLWCARKSNLNRPYMRQVVQKLREMGILALEGMQALHVMGFGMDFEHSEACSQGDNIQSFAGFQSISRG